MPSRRPSSRTRAERSESARRAKLATAMGTGATLDEMAEALGVSRQGAANLLKAAMLKFLVALHTRGYKRGDFFDAPSGAR